MKLWLENIRLNLKVNWKISRNQTQVKENFIVHFETPKGKFLSEIAPNIRYGETVQNIQEEFSGWMKMVDLGSKDLLSSLKNVKLHSLRFGLESVILSYEAKKSHKSLSEYLNLPPAKKVATSFSVPILPISEIEDYLKPLKRFHSLKVKVNAESGEEMLKEIRKHTQVKIRVDANEGWSDFENYLKFQEGLRGMEIEFIEQPFPSSMVEEYKELKKISPYKIMADESIEDGGNFSELREQFHAVNIKLMKTGSLVKARDLLLEARRHGLLSMMGCMIETTVGISYGMLFSSLVDYVDLDGFLLIKDEPFRLIEEQSGELGPML